MSQESSPELLDKLIDRLTKGEWVEIEFKLGRKSLPKSMWPTISAFANTFGGWIVIGASDEGVFEGVENAKKLVDEFHSLINNEEKISHPVCGAQEVDIYTVGTHEIIVIRVPAAPRKLRPIYLNNNPHLGTYVRRATGDYRCTKHEVTRMMREASHMSADSMILAGFGWEDLNLESIAIYRRRLLSQSPSSEVNTFDDKTMLQKIQAYRVDRELGEEGITAAGLMMFGRTESILEWKSRHLIDYRFSRSEDENRWDDRVAWEGNLLGAYEAIYPRLTKFEEVPFKLTEGVRVNQTSVHIALREALVNLLIHADYAENSASLILHNPKGYFFRNPGSSLVPEYELMTGNRSDPRNPILVRMFRLIGLAEDAGTGIPSIIRAWRERGLQIPNIDAGTEKYEFSISLRHAHLFSEEDRMWLSSIGDQWEEAEQVALITAKHHGIVDNAKLCSATGIHKADATTILSSLRARGFLEKIGSGRGTHYQLGHASSSQGLPLEHLLETIIAEKDNLISASDNLISDNEEEVRGDIPPEVWKDLLELATPARDQSRISTELRDTILVSLCVSVPLSVHQFAWLMQRNKAYIREALASLVEQGYITYLYPENPRHKEQKYKAHH